MQGDREILAFGRYGPIYCTTECVIKEINHKRAFRAEYNAYHCLKEVESLRGRIPRYCGSKPHKNRIYLERIHEPNLRKHNVDKATFEQIRKYLLETIDIIHDAGWVHRAIRTENVFTSGMLFDFSYASPKSELSAAWWEHYKRADREAIDELYSAMIGSQNYIASLALLQRGVNDLKSQTELAELLRESDTSSDLLDRLETIRSPIPSLVLEMCRACRREGRFARGWCLLEKCCPPAPRDEQTKRLYVELKAECAKCEPYHGRSVGKISNAYADAISASVNLLGRTDELTIKLRVDFASFLERADRVPDALKEIEALKADYNDLSEVYRAGITKREARLRGIEAEKRKHEETMPAEETSKEDDKENSVQSETHSPPSKKQKKSVEFELVYRVK
ncbi:hypothetical protein AYO20_09117 [Fonsecaea nubica]|uniref:Protein kinase domain-containing protein n=1 Tax=Fonsecaea nubica TaxID=856822 RepID=A0A178CKY5_9EURO|nr:hypothetical protein AYO20_09117 [Fonsecaea nubica]OAL29733.1 hypothetical protein AYO20_09117 [Fonsecaea nubica]